MSILTVNQLRHQWRDGVKVLDIEHLQLERGEKVLLTGASGSGKSTLLNIIAGLLTPSSGEVMLNDRSIIPLSASQRDKLRSDSLGIIYQQLNLLAYLNAVDNVRAALAVSSKKSANQGDIAALLNQLGLDQVLQKKLVTKLSLGQQQRVAIARALIGKPDLVLADEPTASLDRANRDNFMSLLMDQLNASGSSLLMVSHDPDIAHMGFDRVLSLAEVNRVLA